MLCNTAVSALACKTVIRTRTYPLGHPRRRLEIMKDCVNRQGLRPGAVTHVSRNGVSLDVIAIKALSVTLLGDDLRL